MLETITLLENRMHCTTGTNTSSGTIVEHIEFNQTSWHISRQYVYEQGFVFFCFFLFFFPLVVTVTSVLFNCVGYCKSQQITESKHGISSSEITKQAKLKAFQYFLFWVKAEKFSDPKNLKWHHPKFPLNSEDLSSPAMRTQGKFKDWASQLD